VRDRSPGARRASPTPTRRIPTRPSTAARRVQSRRAGAALRRHRLHEPTSAAGTSAAAGGVGPGQLDGVAALPRPPRDTLRTDNPHVLVARGTKAGKTPASIAYLAHLLDPLSDISAGPARHPPGRSGQHPRPQTRVRRIRHETGGCAALPRRPRRHRPPYSHHRMLASSDSLRRHNVSTATERLIWSPSSRSPIGTRARMNDQDQIPLRGVSTVPNGRLFS
jgi:hypothetical protein